MDESVSVAERAAVSAVRFLGSPAYILCSNLFFFGWMTLQHELGRDAFDVYPYILLNLCLSYGSFIAQPLILLASNRSERLLQAALAYIRRVLEAILNLAEGHEQMLSRMQAQQEQNLQMERYQLDILKTLKALLEEIARKDDDGTPRRD